MSKKIVGTLLAFILLSVAVFRAVQISEGEMIVEAGKEATADSLFKFVWDDSLPGYYIVSDQVFPLRVYVLSLPDVGNYRFSNHSSVVEGVLQAVQIRPFNGQVKELTIPLWFLDLVVKLNVSVSHVMVDDWDMYETLVESGNNTIIVNTHDEYLPVPDSYSKEDWVDKIADCMLNRWGTWVHAGGYPLFRVWYQNGTTEEWGELGFKRLMSHVGKGNITCYPPTDWRPEDPAMLTLGTAQGMGINWFWQYTNMALSLADFEHAHLGYPVDCKHFSTEGLHIGTIYKSYNQYALGAMLRYSQNQSGFDFGIYIHLGAWQFSDGGGNELPSEPIAGFISTAAAIYDEFYYATCKLYGRAGDGATEAIQKAESDGRTIGLAEAKNLFQDALDAFASGNYKLSAAYANLAKQTAENASAQNTLPQAIAAIAIIATSIGIGAYYKINNKKKKERS